MSPADSRSILAEVEKFVVDVVNRIKNGPGCEKPILLAWLMKNLDPAETAVFIPSLLLPWKRKAHGGWGPITKYSLRSPRSSSPDQAAKLARIWIRLAEEKNYASGADPNIWRVLEQLAESSPKS